MSQTTSRHRDRICTLLLQSALVSGIAFSPAAGCLAAFGAEAKLTPACEFKEEFNDNVFQSAGNRKSDFIATITPSLTFSHTSERLDINLHSGFSWRDYARSEGIGTTDYRYSAQVANRLTPRDDLGLSASYARNTRPDSIDQTTGLSSSTGSDSYRYSSSLGRAIDETTSASMAYSYAQNSYDNPASQANHVHTANLAFSRDLGAVLPLLKGTIGANFSRAVYRDSSNDIYTLNVGASRNISEKLHINLSVGGQFSHSAFVTTAEEINDSWAAVGSASLGYTGDKGFGSLSFVRNFSAASGQVGAVETTSLGLALGRDLSDRTTAQIAASYNINQAPGGRFSAQEVDDRALSLKADIVCNISRYFGIGFQYAYYAVNHGLNDTLVTQNIAMLRAFASYPVTR